MKKFSCSRQAKIMLYLGIILVVLSAMVTINAADPVIGTITQTGDVVSIPVTGLGDEQITNLVYKGTTPAQSNILYIDQEPAVSGGTTFQFTAPAGTVGTYNVKVGSTTAAAPASTTWTFAPAKPAVPGGVTTGATVTTAELTCPTDTETIDYTIMVKLGAGEYAAYTAAIDVAGTYTAKVVAAEVGAATNFTDSDEITFTVEASGVTIKGNVTPAGSTISDAVEDAKIEVTATLYDSNSAIVASVVADTATGDYQFDNVAPGVYTVDLTRLAALRKNPITADTSLAVEGVVDIGTAGLYIGDMDSNGFIDEFDAYAVVPFYFSVPGMEEYNPIYDMDMNGFIDEFDAYAVVPFYFYVDYID